MTVTFYAPSESVRNRPYYAQTVHDPSDGSSASCSLSTVNVGERRVVDSLDREVSVRVGRLYMLTLSIRVDSCWNVPPLDCPACSQLA